LAIGEKQAKAVKALLVEQGIKPDRLSTFSYGELQPLYTEDDESTWSGNNRVEINFAGRDDSSLGEEGSIGDTVQ